MMIWLLTSRSWFYWRSWFSPSYKQYTRLKEYNFQPGSAHDLNQSMHCYRHEATYMSHRASHHLSSTCGSMGRHTNKPFLLYRFFRLSFCDGKFPWTLHFSALPFIVIICGYNAAQTFALNTTGSVLRFLKSESLLLFFVWGCWM